MNSRPSPIAYLLAHCLRAPFVSVFQASLWNFVRYNVVGGGDSALYGVEDASFYLRNALNNFQVCCL